MRKEIEERIKTANDKLDLSSMGIKDEEIQEIADEIKNTHPNVQSISFENNKIGDAGAIILGKELNALEDLSFLNLQFNQVDKKGIEAVVRLSKAHSSLWVALHGNKITDTGEMDKIEKSIKS